MIDFVVCGNTQEAKKQQDTVSKGKKQQNTVSKFACRIIASRSNQSDVQLYAAGFGGDKFHGVSNFH